uniref:Immunoglobulin V-set domain-containing protein n=1 Tax=Fundulus heteroclitus TaxID=8078 RepID=A0A3Q2U1C3_FUNHE
MALIISFLFHLFLMFILQIQGSTSVNHVFVQTGNDLILNLTEAEIPQNSTFWVWQFNGNSLITFSPHSPPTVPETYTGRIEVLEKTYNVNLKSLQKSDSGIYTAKTVVPREQKLSEYNVTVQDPVSPVDLTVNLTSSTSSSIFTVICRAGNSSISSTLRCENRTCGESRGITTSGSSLHIYQLNESVICNHSNQVSWTESIKKIQDHCSKHGGKTS